MMRATVLVSMAIIVIGAAALAYSLYVIIMTVSTVDLVLLWAILTTLALPVVAVCCWRAGARFGQQYGQQEVKGILSGIDAGVGKVAVVADRIATIKDRRQPKEPPRAVDLRLLPPTVYQELPAGDEVIDL
jgi:membrane protein implicated in regulation of membrane protease activity